MLTDEKKLEIAQRSARRIFAARHLSSRFIDFDELVNISFLGITNDSTESKAEMQSYLWMLNFICHKCRRSVDLRWPNQGDPSFPVYFKCDLYEGCSTIASKLHDTDTTSKLCDVIDLFQAMASTLSSDELDILKDRFTCGMQLNEIAARRGITFQSVADRIYRILAKLRAVLCKKL